MIRIEFDLGPLVLSSMHTLVFLHCFCLFHQGLASDLEIFFRSISVEVGILNCFGALATSLVVEAAVLQMLGRREIVHLITTRLEQVNADISCLINISWSCTLTHFSDIIQVLIHFLGRSCSWH